MRTKYSHLTNAELVQAHRWDIQGDELVDELWLRLEASLVGDAIAPVMDEDSD